MEEDQIELLEKRINKAIAFIEDLKTKKSKLNSEKNELLNKVDNLESITNAKQKEIDELKKIQGFLKSKIEAILDKLESIAEIGVKQEKVLTAESNDNIVESSPESLIIEEEIVDLKNEEDTLEAKLESMDKVSEEDDMEENKLKPLSEIKNEEDSLFNISNADKNISTEKDEEKSEDNESYDNAINNNHKYNLFKNNPFIEP